jgi:hypothetical protein
MNPIDDYNKPLSLSQTTETPDFLEFLEVVKSLLKELNEATGDSKNIFRLFSLPGTPLQLRRQVQMLINLEKMHSEMETLLQQIEKGQETFQGLSKAHETLIKSGSSRLSALPDPASKEGRCIVSADVSGKKAKEIFFALRASVTPLAKTTVSTPKQPNPSVHSPQKTSLQTIPLLKQQGEGAQSSQIAKVLPKPPIQLNLSDKPPVAELWQKIKPLLDHLIVVVETQENMSKPSQKLVGLVRSFIRDQNFFTDLDVSSFLKMAPPTKTLKLAHVSLEQKFSSKNPLPTVKSLLSSPTPPESKMIPPRSLSLTPFLPPLSSKKIIESTQILPEASSKLHQETKNEQPFAAPFTAEKKIERRKSSWKKKLKGFWSKRKPEEDSEEKNPS